VAVNYLLPLPGLAKFALGMVICVTIPFLCRRMHVSVAVGLPLGGVIVGPYVLGLVGTDRPIANFLAERSQEL
jgi:Na+:H+ antiporter